MQIRLQIPPKFGRFRTPKRYKIAIGGRGSGKSITIADLCIMMMEAGREKVGCFREYQKSIEDSVHPLIAGEIDRLGVPGFTVKDKTIEHCAGGKARFAGLQRDPDGIKSMYGFKRFWVEEAQRISHKSLRMLTPTLREAGSEIMMGANPGSRADPFSQRFIVPFERELERDGFYEDDLHTIVVVNYTDNPWFPDVLEQERAFDEANLPRAEYEHIWLGKFNDTVENAIISTEWFDAAIDAHEKLGFKPKGVKVCSHDPSDLGPDDKGLAYRHGSVVLDVQARDHGDVNEGCDWATDYAIEKQADFFVWDCDGIGLSLKRQVSEALDGKRCTYVMFKGSSGVDRPGAVYQDDGAKGSHRAKTNKESFKNRRAQRYWQLRDRFYATYRAVNGEYIDPDELISISSEIKDIDLLRSEVCRIPRARNSNVIQIMNKQEMWEKYEIPSPNMADALMMLWDNPDARAEVEVVVPPAYQPRYA